MVTLLSLRHFIGYANLNAHSCQFYNLKAIVLTKTLKLFQTCMNFFLLPNTKDYFKECTRQLTNLHSIFFLMEVNDCLITNIFFKIPSFVSNGRKKLIQVWNNIRVSK